jgi:hypothetical protein
MIKNFKVISLCFLCFISITATVAIAKTDKEEKIKLIAHEFLQNAPRHLGMPLYHYTQALEEKYKNLSPETMNKVYCRVLEIDPKKALDIMYVSTSGSADGLLPRCERLQLDYLLPDVAAWVDAIRKTAPEIKGTIRSAYIRSALFSLLAAAVAPDIITEVYARSQKKSCDEFTKKITEPDPLIKAAEISIIDYYIKQFGFSEYKARFLAKQHMLFISQSNKAINFTVSR